VDEDRPIPIAAKKAARQGAQDRQLAQAGADGVVDVYPPRRRDIAAAQIQFHRDAAGLGFRIAVF
jgi:hypothetical protein